MAFKMKAGKESPMKKNFGIGKNLPDGRSTSSAFQKPKVSYAKAFENMERVPGKTRMSFNRKNPTTGELYADSPGGLSKFTSQAKVYNTEKSKPTSKTTTPELPTIKPKLTPTTSNLLGTISSSTKPKAKDETNIKLKKNKLTGRTKAKTVEKFDDKVIKTKSVTDRKGNVKTKTKERKRRAGKGKQKIAKALTKLASKLIK
tara:strand:+ start:2450 stop:3055 length:606 start_codon:yes stop_codon:yes gene_type:complete